MSEESRKAWLAEHHTQYTLRDISTLPLFLNLAKTEVAYCIDSEEFRETCEIGPNSKRAKREWKKGETEDMEVGVDRWRYCREFRDAGVGVAVKAERAGDEEWGEVHLMIIPGNESFQLWRMSASCKEYESFSIKDSEKSGTKTGERLHFSGQVEKYTEIYRESPSQSYMERNWVRGNLSGCEKTNKEGENSSGESSVKSEVFSESKSWHVSKDRDWGLIQGNSAGRVWTEKWDKSESLHFEERIVEEGGRLKGFRYEKSASSENRQEWEGETKKHKERGKASRFLDEVKAKLFNALEDAERIEKAAVIAFPSYAGDLGTLIQEKDSLPAASDHDSLIAFIRQAFSLASKHEKLKQKMLQSGFPATSESTLLRALEELAKSSNLTMGLLGGEKIPEKPGVKEGSDACERLVQSLKVMENAKFAILKEKKSSIDDKQLKEELEALWQQEAEILKQIQEKASKNPQLDTKQTPRATVPQLLTALKETQRMSLSFLSRETIGAGESTEWESFPLEGSNEGLSDVRTKLTALVKPYQALGCGRYFWLQALIEERSVILFPKTANRDTRKAGLNSHEPSLLRQLSALETTALSLSSFPEVLATIAQAVRVITAEQAPKGQLTAAVKGLAALVKGAQGQEEEYVEETVVEEEVTETTIQEIFERLETLEVIVLERDEEIRNLRRQMDSKERIHAAIREENEDFRRFKDLYYDQKDENDNLQKLLKTAKVEFSDLKLANEQMKKELSDLQQFVKELKSIEQQAAGLKQENQSLRGVLDALKKSASGSTGNLAVEVESLHRTVSERDQRLDAQQAQINALLLDMKAERTKKERQLLLRLVSTISTSLRAERTHIFLIWKIKGDVPLCDIDFKSMRSLPEFAPNWLSHDCITPIVTNSALSAAIEDSYIWLRKMTCEDNPVYQSLLKGEMHTSALMNNEEFYRRAEELLTLKQQEDMHNFNAHKRAMSMSEFLLTYASDTCEGNKVMAAEFVSRFISTLYIQYSHQTPLSRLLAKLLGLFDPFPAILECSLLVVRINQRFSPLLKPSSSVNMTEVMAGHSAPLWSVLTTFWEEISTNTRLYCNFIGHLKPRDVSAGEFLCSLVQFFAGRAKRTDSVFLWGCFKGVQKGGKVSMDQLVRSLAEHHQLGLPEALLRQAFKDLTPNAVLTEGELSAKSKSVRDRFPEGVPISKASFLLAVAHAYEAELRRLMISNAAGNVALASTKTISEQEFGKAVAALEIGVSAEKVAKMWKETSRAAGEDGVKFPHLLGALALLHLPSSQACAAFCVEGYTPFREEGPQPIKGMPKFKALLASSGRLQGLVKT